MAGCRHPTAVSDSRACQQSTGEFGNSGCFLVAGRVVGISGRTLGGIVVGVRPVSTNAAFDPPYQTTAQDGHFQLRPSRMLTLPPATDPDTLSVYVIATDPTSAGVGVPASVRDSVLVRVTVAPVGTVPDSVDVRVTLPEQ